MTTCRYCEALDCDPEVHEAAANIHAYLRSLVNRNWAKDMAKAKAEAKKLWKERRTPKPDYRVIAQPSGGRNPQGIIERLIAAERAKQAMPVKAAPESIQRGAHLGGIASKSKRPSRAAYMRKYRKTHPEA